jgi:hypothetical protein
MRVGRGRDTAPHHAAAGLCMEAQTAALNSAVIYSDDSLLSANLYPFFVFSLQCPE